MPIKPTPRLINQTYFFFAKAEIDDKRIEI